VRGANYFKEHLYNQQMRSQTGRRCSLSNIIQMEKRGKLKTKVESILVATGVYQEQNDLLFHMRNLFLNVPTSTQPSQSNSENNNDKLNKKNMSTNDLDSTSFKLNLFLFFLI
jgi:hypothetical protein